MPVTRVVILWHQHQPFYKDLVTGEYRLPWVRLHALKDYFGMVKLLEEFPNVHQTFNLVPSLITQIQDYAAGTARDPLLEVAARPANDLSPQDRRFALQYLFQANPVNLIARYPRYKELWERFRESGENPERAARNFAAQDFTDLQVLSQLAWFDEFFLEGPRISALVKKGRDFTLDEQKFVITRERERIGEVLPAHAAAAQQGRIELSTSPFYHPILPLLCDTNQGAVSSPGLPLPQNRFQHPEDAREQLLRGLNLHEQVFGVRPQGVWPSEGSVSEEVLGIAQGLGVNWMATDEGVLGRSLGVHFGRNGDGRLPAHLAEKLYTVYRFDNGTTQMHMIFRDHTISDLVGFVYSGMAPEDAAAHLLDNIRRAAEPVLNSGRDAVIPIILDGENAWEYFPRSGREFLRRFYDRLGNTPGIEAVTVSEAIARHQDKPVLRSLVPGSWIDANFNVWIGAPEDNRSWDYLYKAREFYAGNGHHAREAQRKLAFEELMIAEGSDWNWWYGPEHHSANDRDFDQLYRKHLANVYHLLGSSPPDDLSQPITGGESRPEFTPQTSYIHPRITGDNVRYFEWMGAAVYTADHRAGAMHGRRFMVDSVHAGIDQSNLYGRLDFSGKAEADFVVQVNLESWTPGGQHSNCARRLQVEVENGKLKNWSLLSSDGKENLAGNGNAAGIKLALVKNFEFRLPLSFLLEPPAANATPSSTPVAQIRLRFSVWQNQLPVDSLPLEGWIELQLLPEVELLAQSL
jgi:alpha-amylase/alpha-mannosidase (GH57 family)